MRVLRTFTGAAVLASSVPALAGVIDTRPGTLVGGQVNSTQPIGQTFVADDVRLATFSFESGPTAASQLVGEVWATTGGLPSGGAPIWVGAPQAVLIAGDYFFNPGIDLVLGSTYAIVARSTGPGATTVPLGIVLGNPYAGGQSVVSLDGASAVWQTFPSVGFPVSDLSTRIVMNPEPGTWALFGLGLAGLGAAARRRRKRA